MALTVPAVSQLLCWCCWSDIDSQPSFLPVWAEAVKQGPSSRMEVTSPSAHQDNLHKPSQPARPALAQISVNAGRDMPDVCTTPAGAAQPQSTEAKLADTRPELHYQVGVTPEGIELPRCTMDPSCLDTIEQQPAEHRATVPAGPDPKWRYMWRVGDRPDNTQFKELNAEPVVPKAFPEWPAVMDGWGQKMLAAVETVAAMAAVGFGLPVGTFTQRMHLGPHLLAPTGANLEIHNQLGTCYAGYHYDLNFLTIHGKSRFPGLFVWLRDGRRVPVRIPDGCLFIQAGKQMEWLTGGHVRGGYHEVVCTEATQAAIAQAEAAGRTLWRVSSTMFTHIASDAVLQPLEHFATSMTEEQYPAIPAGEFVQRELEAIKLKAPC
ncbi:hypothetical protein WJX72_007371 [[Myrmecia] bisecta]|uniref:Isopenicillin N synthase-like Fe(2+) 2OG dioxygenase domain-containing protein n=1 Tax=[Myrmecia] bisecta TaxID=41462 RepID=A0AAW1PXJ8_9CHLO